MAWCDVNRMNEFFNLCSDGPNPRPLPPRGRGAFETMGYFYLGAVAPWYCFGGRWGAVGGFGIARLQLFVIFLLVPGARPAQGAPVLKTAAVRPAGRFVA